MKKIDELGISPTPWKNHGVEHGSLGFVRVRDKYGFFVADAKGESDDNANANGDILAAAPELYDCLREAVLLKCSGCASDAGEECLWQGECYAKKWRAALGKAGGV